MSAAASSAYSSCSNEDVAARLRVGGACVQPQRTLVTGGVAPEAREAALGPPSHPHSVCSVTKRDLFHETGRCRPRCS